MSSLQPGSRQSPGIRNMALHRPPDGEPFPKLWLPNRCIYHDVHSSKCWEYLLVTDDHCILVYTNLSKMWAIRAHCHFFCRKFHAKIPGTIVVYPFLTQYVTQNDGTSQPNHWVAGAVLFSSWEVLARRWVREQMLALWAIRNVRFCNPHPQSASQVAIPEPRKISSWFIWLMNGWWWLMIDGWLWPFMVDLWWTLDG